MLALVIFRQCWPSVINHQDRWYQVKFGLNGCC